jgi:hypothetical protein
MRYAQYRKIGCGIIGSGAIILTHVTHRSKTKPASRCVEMQDSDKMAENIRF